MMLRSGRRLAMVPVVLVTATAVPGQVPTRPIPVQPAERAHTLMPVPSSLTWGTGQLRLDSTVTLTLTRFSNPRLRRAAERFLARLEDQLEVPLSDVVRSGDSATIAIQVDSAGDRVQSIDEDESYTLEVTPASVRLAAPTVVGALRGMETLLQLVESDRSGFYLPAVQIHDVPRFRWRGLLLDVSRHFMPVETIKRTLDGMEAVKLNVFHWHLTDDQGFRVESKRYPRLHERGSDGLYYTQAQIREIVTYAHDRGIRVIPEFDMPGHATSWFVGYPHLASLPGPFEITRTWGLGQAAFDPTREEVYTFIERFVAEMAPLFPDHYWHIGGDEVDSRQWDKNPRIRAFRRQRGWRSNADLQAYFTRRLATILSRHGKRLVGWDEIQHPSLPISAVVQAWRGSQHLAGATSRGHASILSAPYYLDHMRSAEEHYTADPIPPWTDLAPGQQDLVLGGEACLWGEHVNAETVDSRLWPRLAAIAERFWSPREVIQVNDMYRRLWVMNERLERLGLGQLAHVDRMLRQLTPHESTREALRVVLEAVAAPTFGQRIRGAESTQLTPLGRVIDAALPDPKGRWETSMLVDHLLTDSTARLARLDPTLTPGVARERLQALFTRWRDAGERLARDTALTPLAAEAVPAGRALARTAAIGLEALEHLAGNAAPPPGWSELRLAELSRYEGPQNLLRVTIVQPVRRLVGVTATASR